MKKKIKHNDMIFMEIMEEIHEKSFYVDMDLTVDYEEVEEIIRKHLIGSKDAARDAILQDNNTNNISIICDVASCKWNDGNGICKKNGIYISDSETGVPECRNASF